MFSICSLNLFLQIMLLTIVESAQNRNNGVIFDITKTLLDVLKPDGDRQTVKDTLKLMATRSSASNTPISIYYHTELDHHVSLSSDFNKIFKFLEESQILNFTDRFFVTIRDKNWIGQGQNSEKYLENSYFSAFELRFPTLVKSPSSNFVSFSIELPVDDLTCGEINDNNNIIRMIKANYNLTIGYEFNEKSLACVVHNESLSLADYLVVRTTSLNATISPVYSFGIFQKQMDRLVEYVQRRIHKLLPSIGNRPVLYKIEITLKVNGIDEITRVRKTHLLQNYLTEWTWKNINGNPVILYFPESTPAFLKGPDIKWISSNNLLIPSIANILTDFLPPSASIFLEDLATSEFDTVAINGSTWTAMVNNSSPNLLCYKINCRQPKYAYFMIDKSEPFLTPFSDSLKQVQKLSSMQMKSIMFPLEFGQSDTYSWKEIVNVFINISNNNTNYSSICEIWTGYINISDNNCNNTCISNNLVSSVTSLCYIKETTNGFFWKLIVSFKDGTAEDFFLRIITKFDAFLNARKEILESYPGRSITLVMKGEYIGKGISNKNNIYCSEIAEKIGQFYDAIFTWAAIHNIPIILEQQMDDSSFGNPLVWKKLTTSRVADSVPMFIRRLHITSKVFGSWTKGMNPCLIPAENSSSIQNINFDSKYLGTTLKLDLKLENTSMTSSDIETLLLLVMKKARKVEIRLRANQVKILCEIIKNTKFMKYLDKNKIMGRHLYIQSKHWNTTYQEYLKQIASIKPNDHFQVHVMLLIETDEDFAFDQGGIYDGIVHKNCTNLADKVTKNRTFYGGLPHIRCLICETNSIPASSSDKLVMQNFFNYHLYTTKLLKYLHPNLTKVYFRLNSIYDNGTNGQTKNLLLFLSDAQMYGNQYEIHYFFPAFVSENKYKESPSIWNIYYYNDPKNISEFKDIFNDTTFVRKIWNSSEMEDYKYDENDMPFSFWLLVSSEEAIYCGILIILSLIIMITTAVLIKISRVRSGLSNKEVNDFVNGHRETLTAAAQSYRDTKIRTGNIYDGLVYQKKNEILKDDVILDFKNPLSSGKYWTSYRGIIENGQNEVFVRIPHKNSSKEVFKCFLSEVKLLCYMGDHYNIARYVGCYTQELRKKVLWIFMEYYPGGVLLDHLKSRNRKRLEEGIIDKLMKFSREIASGMEYLVSQNVIHGNLSAKQVLLNQHLACKIKGFGFSPKLKGFATQIRNNHQEMLPWQWMAPELLRNSQFMNETDVWSYGVTIWEIFSLGDTPYTGVSWSAKLLTEIENGMRMKIPAFATEAIFSIMNECWEHKPERRPNFSNLVEYFTMLMSQCSRSKALGPSNANKAT